jgi:type II secretory pathway pseudopilin PulG
MQCINASRSSVAIVTTRRRLDLAVLALIVVAAASAIVTWSVTKASRTSQSSSNVAECIQGQLQVAIEQGGGLAGTVPATHGYTFLIVNIAPKSCELHGYPTQIAFSTADGAPVKVSISHEPTVLYAQPKVQRVVLSPGGVASFGISYTYGIAPSGKEPTICLAPLIDIRLPALLSRMMSYEFPVRMDVCEAGRRVEVTPVEGRSTPQPLIIDTSLYGGGNPH